MLQNRVSSYQSRPAIHARCGCAASRLTTHRQKERERERDRARARPMAYLGRFSKELRESKDSNVNNNTPTSPPPTNTAPAPCSFPLQTAIFVRTLWIANSNAAVNRAVLWKRYRSILKLWDFCGNKNQIRSGNASGKNRQVGDGETETQTRIAPRLARYLDLLWGRHGRALLVSEHVIYHDDGDASVEDNNFDSDGSAPAVDSQLGNADTISRRRRFIAGPSADPWAFPFSSGCGIASDDRYDDGGDQRPVKFSGTLWDLLQLRARTCGAALSLDEVYSVLAQVSHALQYLHSHGVAHGALCSERIQVVVRASYENDEMDEKHQNEGLNVSLADGLVFSSASSTSARRSTLYVTVSDWATCTLFADAVRNPFLLTCPAYVAPEVARAFAEPACVSSMPGARSCMCGNKPDGGVSGNNYREHNTSSVTASSFFDPRAVLARPPGDVWCLGMLALELAGVRVHMTCSRVQSADSDARSEYAHVPHDNSLARYSAAYQTLVEALRKAEEADKTDQELVDSFVERELFLLDLSDAPVNVDLNISLPSKNLVSDTAAITPTGPDSSGASFGHLVRACLRVDPTARPLTSDICDYPLLSPFGITRQQQDDAPLTDGSTPASTNSRCQLSGKLPSTPTVMYPTSAAEDDSLLSVQSWFLTKTQTILCELTCKAEVENFLETRARRLEHESAVDGTPAFDGIYLVRALDPHRHRDDPTGVQYSMQLSICRRAGTRAIGSRIESEYVHRHIWINLTHGTGYSIDSRVMVGSQQPRRYGSLGELCNNIAATNQCVPFSPAASSGTSQTSVTTIAALAESTRPKVEIFPDNERLSDVYSRWRVASAGDAVAQLLYLAKNKLETSSVFTRQSILRAPQYRVVRDNANLTSLLRRIPSQIDALDFVIIPTKALSVQTVILQARNAEAAAAAAERTSVLDLTSTAGDAWYEELRRLPLNVREKDVIYQRRRWSIFSDLIQAYSSAKEQSSGAAVLRAQLLAEARVDIPWVARGAVWQAILDVTDTDAMTLWYSATAVSAALTGKSQTSSSHDPEAPTDADKQIELDLPRCHSANVVINSPYGRRLLRRVLRAWVRHNNGNLVYWQGLDSVAAPFVLLFAGTPPRVGVGQEGGIVGHDDVATVVADVDAPENCAARALACLQQFVDKYLHNYFLADNHDQLQAHLAVFSHLLAYHDPILGAHLDRHEFHATLYAIPWFLTMFTHVLQLHQCLPLWDTLIVGPSELPLFVGVGVLRQISKKILALKDFNQILEFFTALPPVDVQQLIEDMQAMFNCTPWPSTLTEYAMHRRDDILEKAVAEKISLAVLQEELCPRMFVRDLVQFRFQLVLVDLRPAKEFSQFHFSGAVNFPLKSTIAHADVDIRAFERLRGRHIVLCDTDSVSTTARAAFVARSLVVAGYPYVSVLHGGFEHLCAQVPDDLLDVKPT